MSNLTKTFSIVAFVVLIDQVLKIWIKTNFTLGQDYEIFSWAIIHFTENNGMAFGWEFGGVWGKIGLTAFRIAAVSGLAWYLSTIARQADTPKSFMYCLGLILAGAVGNIIDSSFYSVLFSESTYYKVAEILPTAGGYAPFLQGKVVDMFYFPMIDSHWPQWLPGVGGEHFIFFRPVFNIADSAIFIGVASIITFHRSVLKKQRLIP